MLGGERGRRCGGEVDGGFLSLRWSSEEAAAAASCTNLS